MILQPNSQEKQYVYALVDPETGAVRYIGRSNKPQVRYNHHMTGMYSRQKRKWIDDLATRGLRPTLTILEECEAAQVEERETYWLYHYIDDGAHLLNSEDHIVAKRKRVQNLKPMFVRLTPLQHDLVQKMISENGLKQSDALRDMVRLWVEAHGEAWPDSNIKHGDASRFGQENDE